MEQNKDDIDFTELQKQQADISSKMSVISMRINKRYEDERQKHFEDNIKGKFFYADGDTFRNYKDPELIVLVKVLSCNEFRMYNSCNVLRLQIRYDKDAQLPSITIGKDTNRVDMLGKEYQLLTNDKLELFRSRASEALEEMFNFFKQ